VTPDGGEAGKEYGGRVSRFLFLGALDAFTLLLPPPRLDQVYGGRTGLSVEGGGKGGVGGGVGGDAR
jgi:hypothetical protein